MRIIDYFDNGVASYPDHVAFIDIDAGGTRMRYRQAWAASVDIADGLHGHGYGKGSHIGILAPNGTPAFLALLGLFRAGGVWLPINPRNSTAVNVDLLTRFDGELLFYHSSYEAEAGEILSSVAGIRAAVCLDRAGAAGPALAHWCRDTRGSHRPVAAARDDLVTIFPTGGTTGQSKGVMMTHGNIQAMFANFYAHFRYYDDTCHLVVAPMTHSAGLLGCLHFARGGTNAIMAKADPLAIMRAIPAHRVTHLFLPPTVLYMMLASPAVRDFDYSSLQHFLVGAAPTSLEKLKEAVAVFGPVMSEAFGQAEAPAVIAAKAPWDYLDRDGRVDERRLHSVGRACVHNQVAILDDDGVEVPRGQPGEICVRGDLVTPGYYRNEQETAKVRTFGWHHTGDIGVMADDGYITIVDRKKDMIITGGFNVFPNEIEQVLSAHPAVQDCLVIGVPDEKWGEAVKAVVQLKPDAQADAAELIALAKAKLGGVKAPKSVDFVDDLPRSPAGKALKTELRARYWQGRARAVN
ncbi:MAG: AMP-binding protein [Gammaproteobacteria bacterium]|nr:AMP-binding protein [Gammaproteobacteria bacterium]